MATRKMIVPDYWAEARQQSRKGKRQVTVRRLGWSMVSEADALAMAETRASEALTRILSGEKLARHESKVAYNGAFGVPIREEVLLRRGEDVITRNGYGARCLNTPRALFADIDYSPSSNWVLLGVILACLVTLSIVVGLHYRHWGVLIGLLLFSFALASPIASLLGKLFISIQGGSEKVARQRLLAFLKRHPTWNLRLYKTPNGLRVLVTHQAFDPAMPEVQHFFTAVGVDPIYRRMCLNQHCFRARLTAKPWRIGISAHLRPRPGIWPVHPDRLPQRTQWVADYERVASGFAACHFLESLGSGVVHNDLRHVIELHDQESRANYHQLPIA